MSRFLGTKGHRGRLVSVYKLPDHQGSSEFILRGRTASSDLLTKGSSPMKMQIKKLRPMQAAVFLCGLLPGAKAH